jgi:hypothetical protein
MKFTLFPLLALMAIPGLAQDTPQKLDQPLSLIIATNWSNGWVADELINFVSQYNSTEDPADSKVREHIDIPATDSTPAETVHLVKVKTFNLDEIGDKVEFRMERDKWSPDYLQVSLIRLDRISANFGQCTVTVEKDPHVPIVHILLMGNDDDHPDDGDYKVNVYGEEVKMMCDKLNLRDRA